MCGGGGHVCACVYCVKGGGTCVHVYTVLKGGHVCACVYCVKGFTGYLNSSIHICLHALSLYALMQLGLLYF